MPRPAALVLVLGLVLAVPGLAADDPPGAQTESVRLERLVLQDCGSCHGLSRKGGLGPDLRAEALRHWDAESLALVILDGIPGTAMPPWRPIMTDAEAAWIADYLLTGDK